MQKTIKGSFEIQSTLLPGDEVSQALGAMRMTFEKQFSGELQATSRVSMIGMMNKELGSGAYVALEKVTGTLEGRQGSFCLQHNSTMNRGQSSQSISVIPDSGSGELSNLSGHMTIDIINGQHYYTFVYSL